MEKAPPPSYSESQESATAQATPNSVAGDSTVGEPIPYSVARNGFVSGSTKHPSGFHIPVLPKSFGFYGASGTLSDLVIALSAESPPILYISTHGAFSSQPSLVVHSSQSQSAAPIATAAFHSFAPVTDVTLCNQSLQLRSEGTFSSVTYFHYPMPQANGQTQLERFEWKASSGQEVQLLQGSSHGLKCVRSKTGQVVAAWARPNLGHRKKGKMWFLMRERGLSDAKLEILVVISVLSIVEQARKKKSGGRRRAGLMAGGMPGGFAGGGAAC